MKVGNLVRTTMPFGNNDTSPDRHPGPPRVESGTVGMVVGVRQTNYNAAIGGKGDVYIDVLISAGGKPYRCGNYLAGYFEVIA